jgi:PAS domain S-box-containing protein
LGYRRGELIGRNIAAIMPKIYGDNHNATLTRYIRASESKVNGHERVVPALTKEGFILPTTALTKALPTLAKGIQIVGFLAKM